MNCFNIFFFYYFLIYLLPYHRQTRVNNNNDDDDDDYNDNDNDNDNNKQNEKLPLLNEQQLRQDDIIEVPNWISKINQINPNKKLRKSQQHLSGPNWFNFKYESYSGGTNQCALGGTKCLAEVIYSKIKNIICSLFWINFVAGFVAAGTFGVYYNLINANRNNTHNNIAKNNSKNYDYDTDWFHMITKKSKQVKKLLWKLLFTGKTFINDYIIDNMMNMSKKNKKNYYNDYVDNNNDDNDDHDHDHLHNPITKTPTKTITKIIQQIESSKILFFHSSLLFVEHNWFWILIVFLMAILIGYMIATILIMKSRRYSNNSNNNKIKGKNRKKIRQLILFSNSSNKKKRKRKVEKNLDNSEDYDGDSNKKY